MSENQLIRGKLGMDRPMARRTLCLSVLLFLSLLLFWKPFNLWVQFSFLHVHLSHTIFIPGLSLILIWRERKRIFSSLDSSYRHGLVLLLLAAVLYGAGHQSSFPLSQQDYLSVTIFALVLTWLALFVFCYGSASFRAATFPLLFLLLMVPVPEFLLEKIITALQDGSAVVAHKLFELSGVPTYREGFVFTLPGLVIEVAEECSGIRSSIALLVVSLLAGHLSLRSRWGKLSLTLSILPLVVLKNGLRIVVITLLGLYVDRGFLDGYLHQRGGIVFFLVSLVLLAFVLKAVQRFERWNSKDDGLLAQPSTSPGNDGGRPAQALPGP